MKQELEIAKELIEEFTMFGHDNYRKQHKVTCERWLEFLEIFARADVTFPKGYNLAKYINFNENKIKDLQETIKLYSENGI